MPGNRQRNWYSCQFRPFESSLVLPLCKFFVSTHLALATTLAISLAHANAARSKFLYGIAGSQW